MTHVQCDICLDYHIAGAHCHSCGALRIGRTHYQITTGVEMVRALPRPLHHIIDAVITYSKALPDAQLVKHETPGA